MKSVKSLGIHPSWFIGVIVLGALLRLATALIDFPFVFPDEQYQTLEPANWVINGFGFKTWEWFEGIRSWFLPALYMPVLWGLKALGIEGGPVSILVCRAWTAIFGIGMLWRFHRLLEARGLDALPRFVALMLLCLSSAMVAWSATTFGESWALILLWAGMPALVRLDSGKFSDAIWAGLLIGLTFLARLQMAAWFVGLALVLLWKKADRKILLALCVGYALPVVIQGALDWATWGAPFYSTYKNFMLNVVRGVADLNGRSPWSSYFIWIPRNLGTPVSLLLFLVPLLGLSVRAIRFERLDRLILIPSLVFAAAHLIIGHKEVRFLLPIFPAFFYLFAVTLDGVLKRWPIRIPARGGAIGMVLLMVLGALYSFQNIYAEPRYSSFELSGATRIIYNDGGLRTSPPRCILFVDHFWIWSRGEMGLGQRVEHIDVKSGAIDSYLLQRCLYAVVPKERSADFESYAPLWLEIGRDRWGHRVYRNQ